MNRRDFLNGGSALAALSLAAGPATSLSAQEQTAAQPQARFNHAWLVEEARRLASEPYQDPSNELPGDLAEIGYDQYRDIRYKREARIWAEDGLRFRLDLLHRGFIFADPVEVAIVEGGVA